MYINSRVYGLQHLLWLQFFRVATHANRKKRKFPQATWATTWFLNVANRTHPRKCILHLILEKESSINYVSILLDFYSPTNPLCQHKYRTERQQNWPFSRPIQSFADVIYGWSHSNNFKDLSLRKMRILIKINKSCEP